MRFRFLLVLLIIASTVVSLVAGGPWLQTKKSGYSQVSVSGILSYNELFSKNSDPIRLNRNVTDITIMGYVEYGLEDNLTLIGHIPFKLVNTADQVNPEGDFSEVLPSGSLAGFGNIAIALKSNFIHGTVLISGQIRIDANTVKFQESTGLRSGYSSWGLMPSIIVGGSIGSFYSSLDLGIRLRSNQYSRDVLVNIEIGYALSQKFWISGVMDVLHVLSEGSRDPDGTEQTGLYADNQAYLAYGFKLISDISSGWGLNASIFSAGSGNLVARSMAYTLGVYHKW